MTIRYVWSGASGAGTGADFTNAYTTFGAAVTASVTNGDLIVIADDHSETLAADTTYAFSANVNFLCVNRASGLESEGAFIGHTSSNFFIKLAGAGKVFGQGTTFQVAGSTTDTLEINSSGEGHFELEKCKLYLTNTTSGGRINLGNSASSTVGTYTRLRQCELKFGHASQSILAKNEVDLEAVTINSAGSAPTTLFADPGAAAAVKVVDSDLSHVTGTLVGNCAGNKVSVDFITSKLGSGVVVLATQTTNTHKASASANIFDCAAGDQHYHRGHYDAFGSTVVDTGIYANDGAAYDGTNRCSWKITTTANCSFYTPYVSPWFGRYHSATSAITPYIEILRDGSTTAYQDDEVWPEFSAKTTAGSTRATLYRDRMALMGTPVNRVAGVGTSGWTGENVSAWSGKLTLAASFTPAEIGHLMARICVGEPSITLYADPAIRGAV